MQDIIMTAVNIGGWAVVLAIIYDRLNKLEEKISNCIVPQIQELKEETAILKEKIKLINA